MGVVLEPEDVAAAALVAGMGSVDIWASVHVRSQGFVVSFAMSERRIWMATCC